MCLTILTGETLTKKFNLHPPFQTLGPEPFAPPDAVCPLLPTLQPKTPLTPKEATGLMA